MSDQFLDIPIRSAGARWGVCAAAIVAAGAFAVVSARWAVAETLVYVAARTPLPPAALSVAHALAPANPETAYVLGSYDLDNGRLEDAGAARALLEQAAVEAPNRSAVWLALGRAREQAGDVDGAVAALERAHTLAPTYSTPPWALGNLYVRQGRTAEGAVSLRRAARMNPELAPIAVRTIWMATDKDVPATLNAFEESPAAETELVGLLLDEKRLDDALALWRTLARADTPDDALAEKGRQLAAALLAAGRGDDFASVLGQVDASAVPASGALANGGFEESISDKSSQNPFRWAVTQASDARVSVDTGHDSAHALRVDYEAQGGTTFTHATQLVRVEPGKSYTLTFWASTNDLKTGGPPELSVVDAGGDGRALGAAALATGTTEWTQYRIPFVAPAGGFVTLRVDRQSCGAVCPAFGQFRVDDVAISK